MKKSIVIALLISFGLSAIADDSAATNNMISAPGVLPDSVRTDNATRFGVGVILGEPTGASLKYFFTDTFAIDGAVGWSFHDETDFHLHADALWHKHDLFDTTEGQLSLYCGVGGRVKFRDHAEDRVGVRIPVGVSYKFDRAPVDLFVEVAPIIDFTPSTKGSFSAGVGARYWF
jgi:hypothetical protein